jgi:transketolase N-terminal domain/subunit
MTNNEQRIIDISKRLGLAHISSNLSCLPILEEIYANKAPEDKVLMGNAHAHLSHLVVKAMSVDEIEQSIQENGIHCDREAGCDASGGSLGHALGIAIGMSIANKKIKIHVITSDGEMMEGSNWEALRIIEDKWLDHIQIYCNFNGYTAVSEYDTGEIEDRMRPFNIGNMKFYHTSNGEGFSGLEGHYKKIIF